MNSGETALPLVSCIMPTADRRAFVPRALRYFLAQDYPARELVIVDDGQDPVADLIPADPRIRYLRTVPRCGSLGLKRNLACEAARGPLVLHWDDDDWMGPSRISRQVTALLAAKADLGGLNRFYLYQPQTGLAWEYAPPGKNRPWVYGATFCFRKGVWRERPFREITVGEDGWFVRDHAACRFAIMPNDGFFIAISHAANTSPKRVHGSGYRPRPAEMVQQFMGPDWNTYHSGGNSAGSSGNG